ncbi:MAG TPA: hypothetical protein VN763_06600 [Saprospiraceae bacterium]|nr:hypothetical protein [Saprospiraceae bacterium]
MNTAHWHLLLNHLPMVGIVIGTTILAGGYIFKNNPTIKATALGVFVLSALVAIPAYLTGEGAEDIAEKMPGVTEGFIENHEDLGKIFLILAESLGVMAIFTLIMFRLKSKLAPTLFGIVLIAALGTSIFAKQVGTSGGQVRHTEIRNSNAQPLDQATEQNGGAEQDDD